MPGRQVRIVEPGVFDAKLREEGVDWPADAESMVGLKRLANIRECVEQSLIDGVPGDLVETGVWRGGSCIFMRGVLAAYGDPDRRSGCATPSRGCPSTTAATRPTSATSSTPSPSSPISVEEVQENFRRYGLLDDRVEFLKGWFADTLGDAPIEQIAVLRLDGDMYSSTMDALEPLYDKVSPGGFVIVDDYGARPGVRAGGPRLPRRPRHHRRDPQGRLDGRLLAQGHPVVSDPNAVEEGVARLDAALAGTRANAERALRELHRAMQRDLRRAERRADRAERRVADLRDKLGKARRRAKRLERRLATAQQAPSGLRKTLGRVRRKVMAGRPAAPSR